MLDDDSELADKYGDTNANPYVDGTANNEPENLNTKTVKPGSKLVYQVWLDTNNLAQPTLKIFKQSASQITMMKPSWM